MKRQIKALCTTALLTLSVSGFAANFCDELPKTTDLVTVGSKKVLLSGNTVNVGDKAPDFKVIDEKFRPVYLSNFTGKTVLISVVPSLDTGVCSLQTKRFNESVAELPDDVVMLTISTDLPFAQKRFCQIENVDKLQVLSDSVWRNFGASYGMLITDMGLLARSIWVIKPDGTVGYKEIVEQLSNHPDYDKALNAVRTVAGQHTSLNKQAD